MPQGVAKKAGFYGNSETHFKIEITKNGELFLPSNPKKNMYILLMEALLMRGYFQAQLCNREEWKNLFEGERI